MADQTFYVRPSNFTPTNQEPTGGVPQPTRFEATRPEATRPEVSPSEAPAQKVTVPSVDRDEILKTLAKAKPPAESPANIIRETLHTIGRDFVVETDSAERADFYAKENALFQRYQLNNPQAEQYAQGVLDKLIPHIPGVIRGSREKSFKVVILDSEKITEEGNGIQKEMARGTSSGTIYITTDLLKSLKNEAELAFVLSHELVHSVRDHSMRNNHEVAAGISELNKRGISGADLTRAHARNLQAREDEADMWGLQILDAAQYDVKAAEKVIAREGAHDHDHSSEESEKRLANRLRDINVFTKVRGYDENGGDIVGKDPFRQFLKSL